MPTSKGQALADEYGIKLFETLNGEDDPPTETEGGRTAPNGALPCPIRFQAPSLESRDVPERPLRTADLTVSRKHDRYWLLSRRTFRNRKPAESSSTGTKERKEDTSVGESDSSPGDAARTSLPDASYPENLYPLQNRLESDLSRSPSEDSTSLEDFPCNGSDGIPSNRLWNRQSDRMELPRRGNLLRDQPTRPFVGGRGGDRRWIPVGGSRYDGHRPLFSNLGSKQEPTPPYDGDRSYSHHPLHHPEDYNNPVQLPPSTHCTACSSPTCYHSSSTASSRRQKADRDGAAYQKSETTDHHREELPRQEKREHKKRRRHCRPAAAAACFGVAMPIPGAIQRRAASSDHPRACSRVRSMKGGRTMLVSLTLVSIFLLSAAHRPSPPSPVGSGNRSECPTYKSDSKVKYPNPKLSDSEI